MSYVKANPGAQADQIASALGVQTKALERPIIQLLASKTISRSGQRRGTTYSVGSGGGAGSLSNGRRKAKRRARKA